MVVSEINTPYSKCDNVQNCTTIQDWYKYLRSFKNINVQLYTYYGKNVLIKSELNFSFENLGHSKRYLQHLRYHHF